MADEPTQTTSAAAPAAAPPTPTPQPIEVKTATGQVYRGNSYEEVVQQLVTAQENATRTIAEFNRQQKPPETPEQYNAQKAYELFASDPKAYNDYMKKYDPDYQRLQKVAQQVEDYAITAAFQQACPEFPQGEKKASDAVVEMAGKIMAAYEIEKLTVPVMVMAHQECVRQGLYPAVKPVVASTTSPNTPPPPPPPSSTTTDAIPDEAQAWKMTKEQIADFLAKYGGNR